MENIKSLEEIKTIIEIEKNNLNTFIYFNIDFDRVDNERGNLIYKFREYISATSLLKLKHILKKNKYTFIISNIGEIIIFSLK